MDEIVTSARNLLEDVRRNHPGLTLRFSGEDAFRTPLDALFRVYDPLVEYVDRLGMPDTVGVARPPVVTSRVRALRERYPHTPLELHFHDDRGLALIYHPAGHWRALGYHFHDLPDLQPVHRPEV